VGDGPAGGEGISPGDGPAPSDTFPGGDIWSGSKDLGDIGSFAKWAKVEVPLVGPASQGAGTPNPFAIEVDVTFAGPGGQQYKVPAFYDGDGRGGLDGAIWKVRFAADELGQWTFSSDSASPDLAGYTGSFTVTAPPPNAPDFFRWGRLEHTGTAANKIRYLKFRDGDYWLKAGCDDPENFLGSSSNYDSPAKRKAAVDYLAAKGINSMYIMTHNLDGDDKDVWPWLGQTASEAKGNGGSDARFDVAKLEMWREVFEHMQYKGVVVYLVLEDDSAWTGYDHPRYYRELVARFGHLPALLFNLNEEYNENYSMAEALGHMSTLEQIDPYDHPRGIHNVNNPNDEYLKASQIDFTAIQTKGSNPLDHNQLANDWIAQARSLGVRVPMIGFDEPRPEMDRKGWWSGYMGGAVWEVHTVKPYDRPMSAFEPAWTELGGARTFMESIPFAQMEPDNALVTSGTAYCLAQPGEAYALYLPSGGTIEVSLATGATYKYDWWNPGNGRGGSFESAGTVDGGAQQLTAPGSGDWALRILKQ
jgi:hypothetical protein